MFKYVRNEVSETFDNMYVKMVIAHNHRTRQDDSFYFPTTSNIRKMSQGYQGIRVWNNIAKHINMNCSVSILENLKNYILEKRKFNGFHERGLKMIAKI